MFSHLKRFLCTSIHLWHYIHVHVTVNVTRLKCFNSSFHKSFKRLPFVVMYVHWIKGLKLILYDIATSSNTIWIHPVNSQQQKCITNHCKDFFTWIFREHFLSNQGPLSTRKRGKKTSLWYKLDCGFRLLCLIMRNQKTTEWHGTSTLQHGIALSDSSSSPCSVFFCFS